MASVTSHGLFALQDRHSGPGIELGLSDACVELVCEAMYLAIRLDPR